MALCWRHVTRTAGQTLILRNAIDQNSGKASLRQVVATRKVLDLGIADDVVTHFTGTHNPELHTLVDTMVERATNGQTYLDEDIAFHEALIEFAGDSLIAQLMSAMWLVHQAFIPGLGAPPTDELTATAHAHRAMLEAAENGDLEAYKNAVDAHIRLPKSSTYNFIFGTIFTVVHTMVETDGKLEAWLS